jgi:membrane protein DedA with SNARE-associated domain
MTPFLHSIFLLINHYGYFIIGLFILLECLGIPFPGETSLVLGAVYAQQNPSQLNIIIVIITGIIAASLGDNIGYFIGEKYGIAFISFLSNILKRDIKYVSVTKKFFDKYGLKTVFIGRFLSVFRMFIPITAGIHKIEYKRFFIYNISGATLWSIFYGALGFYLGTNLKLLESILTNISYTIITIIIVIIIYVLFKRYEKAKYNKI